MAEPRPPYLPEVPAEDIAEAAPEYTAQQVGRIGLSLVDEAGSLAESEIDENRELTPQEIAVLADFRGHGRAIVEWYMRHPGVRAHPRDVYPRLAAPTVEAQRRAYVNTMHRIKKHHALSPYFHEDGETKSRRHWLDAEWAAPEPEEEAPVAEQALKAAKLRAALSRCSLPEPRLPADLEALVNDPTLPVSGRWPGRHPSLDFELAIWESTTNETALSDKGLKIVEFKGEEHVLLDDRLIDLPLTGLKMMHILALHPMGLTSDALRHRMQSIVPNHVKLEEVQGHLAFIERQLQGTGTFQKAPAIKEANSFYWIPGALERDVSEWPQWMLAIKPVAALGRVASAQGAVSNSL